MFYVCVWFIYGVHIIIIFIIGSSKIYEMFFFYNRRKPRSTVTRLHIRSLQRLLASPAAGTQGDDFGDNLSKSPCSYFSSFLFLLFLSTWIRFRNFRISIPYSLQIFKAPNLPPRPGPMPCQPEFQVYMLWMKFVETRIQ